jgi:Ras-related GTP-binding protein A/B
VDLTNDLNFFANVMSMMERNSSDASIFVLIHKMDLVAEEARDRTFEERKASIQARTSL